MFVAPLFINFLNRNLYIVFICFLFQGASSTYPSFYCDITQTQLKNHNGVKHNFETVKCCVRQFDVMEGHLKDQIKGLGEEFEHLSDNVNDFFENIDLNQRNDVERKFRSRGKNHKSIIGQVNSGVKSMEFEVGGELHNEIGLIIV
jgi:hypothetical protein